jgi:hypothetical protein
VLLGLIVVVVVVVVQIQLPDVWQQREGWGRAQPSGRLLVVVDERGLSQVALLRFCKTHHIVHGRLQPCQPLMVLCLGVNAWGSPP